MSAAGIRKYDEKNVVNDLCVLSRDSDSMTYEEILEQSARIDKILDEFQKTKYVNKILLLEYLLYPIYKKLFRYIYFILKDYDAAYEVMYATIKSAYMDELLIERISDFNEWIFDIAKMLTLERIKKDNQTTLQSKIIKIFKRDKGNRWSDKNINDRFVLNMINDLENEYKDIILLRYYFGLSLREIAQARNMNVAAVKSRINKVLRILEKKLCSFSKEEESKK